MKRIVAKVPLYKIFNSKNMGVTGEPRLYKRTWDGGKFVWHSIARKAPEGWKEQQGPIPGVGWVADALNGLDRPGMTATEITDEEAAMILFEASK